MAGTRISNLQNVGKQPPLILPHQLTGAAQGTVQMRIKSSQNSGERLSQTKSMVLQDPDLPPKPISRHRRNQSQHNIGGAGAADTLVVLKGEYLNKAKISDGGKKLRKNWTSTWVVLETDKLLFYKESKQEALTNLKPGCSPDGVDLCGAVVEWTTERSSRKNVVQNSLNWSGHGLYKVSKVFDSVTTSAKAASPPCSGRFRRSASPAY